MVIDNQYLSLTYTTSYTLSNYLKIRLLQPPAIIFNSKTSCFTLSEICKTCRRSMTLQSKTSCFTMSDSSDRCEISITLPNNLAYNKIQRKVIDNKKNIISLIIANILYICHMKDKVDHYTICFIG